MNDTHEPRESFVRALEARVTGELTRRSGSPRLPRWVPQSRGRMVFATAVLVLVSMAVGGAAVAVTYQAQTAESRDLLARTYQARVELGKARLDLAAKLLKTMQERVAVGAASHMELQDATLKVRQAEFEVQSLQLQLNEVRLSGLEPSMQVSAPLVSGRDFVTQHWRLEIEAQKAALETEQLRLKDTQTRVSVGMADSFDVEPARARVKELEVALLCYQRKLEIRQQFLNKSVDAGLADLTVLAVEADQRVETLKGRIDLSKKELQRAQARFTTGNALRLDVAEAEIRVQQTELDLSKAQYDLLLIRRQIEQRGR